MTQLIRLGARLRAARKAAGFKTAKSFLKKYRIPASTYSQYESGTRTPDTKTLKTYSKLWGVNQQWLTTGKGQPYRIPTSEQRQHLQEELTELKKPANSLHALQEKKQKSEAINSKKLTAILEGLLSKQPLPLSSAHVTTIARKAAQLYAKVIKD